MVGLPCLVIQCAKFHVAGWTWAVFTHVYLESCTWPVVIFTIDRRKEQRVCIKFCANLGKRAMETLTIIQQTFGDQIFSRTQVFQWHARFKTGRTLVDGEEHTERTTRCTIPETVARIQELVRQDQRRTIHHIAEEMRMVMGHANGFWRKNWACTVSQFHNDNAPSHTSFLIQQFLAKYKMAVIPHSPYSPGLVPCDFFIFPKWNWSWKDAGFISLRRSRPNRRVLDTNRKGLPGSVPKM
jgi:hypothetical protein